MLHRLAGLAQPWGYLLVGLLALAESAAFVGRASAVLLVMAIIGAALAVGARAVARREAALRTWVARQGDRGSVARTRARFSRQLAFLARRLRPGGALGLSVTVGLAGLTLLGWAFGALLVDVAARNELRGLDGSVYRFFGAHRSPALTAASRVATHLGDATFLLPLAVLGAVFVWRRTRRRLDLVLAPVALAGGALLADIVKRLVGRPRPPVGQMLASASGYAFPSGHATQSAACYLALAVTAFGLSGSWRVRVASVTATVAVVALVGFSRITLGVHWLSDVLAGWVLGALWVGIVVLVVRVLHDLNRQPPGDQPTAGAKGRAGRNPARAFGLLAGSEEEAARPLMMTTPEAPAVTTAVEMPRPRWL